MYVVYFGTNRNKVRDKATAYMEKELSPDTTITVIESVDYEFGQVADALGASSLFGGGQCFVFDTPSENDEFYTEVVASLEEMAASINFFVVLEGALLAPEKKKYTKYAKNIEEFKLSGEEKFNSFSLAEALANKDKRQFWVLLQEARQKGLPDEAIVGMLWWQLKTLRLAKVTRSAAEAGMKDYPYNKAKRALSKFSEGEVEKLSQLLLQLYHDGHGGVRDMSMSLEEWVLRI